MRIIFMGTPDFAVCTLDALVQAGHEVVAVITQPDKPKGRGKTVQYTPVKEKALQLQIPVYQPLKVRDPEVVNWIEALAPDAIIVVAFGQLLPESILSIPKYGCINVHASLLPKYRGAAPIQWAVIDGNEISGVTTMYMAKGLDTGDMIEQLVVPIDKKETGGTYHDKLAIAGAKLCVSTLAKLQEGTADRIPQEDKDSCYAHMLDKKLGCIQFTQSAVKIEHLIRGLNPWPSAYTRLYGKTLKIFEAEIVENRDAIPGTIIEVDKKSFTVQCGENALKITNLQLEGKKRMDTEAFLLGNKIEIGMKLGE